MDGGSMSDPNRYAGVCIRCGHRVEAWAGYHSFGNATKPYPWPQYRYMRNINIVEHKSCHERWAGTSRHYVFDPLGGAE